MTFVYAWIVPLWAAQLLPQLSMEQFDTLRIQCRHIEQMHEGVYNFCCPPPFRRKAEGHSFRHSVLPSFRPSVRPSVLPSFRPPNIVGTLCAQLLLQFYADSFETLQMF